MKFAISIILVCFTLNSCTNSKGSLVKTNGIEIISVSYQEKIAGVKGQGSTFHFDFDIKITDVGIVPDSVFFMNNAGKIHSNYGGGTFYANVKVIPTDVLNVDDNVRISFKSENTLIILIADSVTIKERVFLP